MTNPKKILAETKAYACLDCGKCTAVCGLARHTSDFSPRMLVYDALHDTNGILVNDERLWQCLTCAACETICTSGVHYGDFVRAFRAAACEQGISGQCTHGGALQSLMHIMGTEQLQQNRLDWIPKQLEVAETSETVYFVGCAPYFDAFFADIDSKTLRAAKGSVALLNAIGIVPALSPNERCCGHDLLNAGDIEGFLRLARQNVEEIKKSGAKRVVTSCPEGYHTIGVEYPRYLGNTGLEVIHLTQLIADAVRRGELSFQPLRKRVVYHDPCRLGRISGIYDEPRLILEAIPELAVLEMVHRRSGALCCGTQSWMNCGSVNKEMQLDLLREAMATGADTLITACPKCQIHLKCAMHDDKLGQELRIQIQDFAAFVAGALVK